MVLFTKTPAITAAIEYLEQTDQLHTLNLQPPNTTVSDLCETGSIAHDHVMAISRRLRELRKTLGPGNTEELPSAFHLDDLLRGARIYIQAPKPKPESTSEYKALMARLRQEEEQRAYERMTNRPRPTETFAQRFPGAQHAHLFPTTAEDIGNEDDVSYADISRQMTLIINVLVTVVACSVAIWIVARQWSVASRLGLSMGGSGLVGVAEVAVYLGYLRRVKDAQEKSKKQVEVKEILETWVIGEENSENDEAVSTRPNSTRGDEVRRRRPDPTRLETKS